MEAAQALDGEPVARVLVAGATGYTGALAASLVWHHPRLELVGATSRGDAGTRLDRLHPRHRVPVVLEELDLARAEEADAAIVAYPHGASAPAVANSEFTPTKSTRSAASLRNNGCRRACRISAASCARRCAFAPA